MLRRGRFTEAQRRAFDRWLPVFGVPYSSTSLDFQQTFGRDAPTVLEIGFGMGETTAAIAQSRPDINFLGVEVFTAGIGALLKRIDELQLTNVRIVHHDAAEVVHDMIAPRSLAGIHIFFPDPWPKKRHHKRRLLQPSFISLLADRLAPGGYLHCATDWDDYAQQMLDLLHGESQLVNLHEGCALTPSNPLCIRPTTKFHARGERLGHAVCDLVFAKLSGDVRAKGIDS
ncbi:MAG: tRNA (guanosine(46)-N7)-methyltransferase TrmB [Burkholderiaceae bacterium]